MRKTLILIAALSLACGAFAGEIANKFMTDISIGALGGAALGAAFSTPSYLTGGENANPKVFAAGSGWGALIGAGCGLIYGFWDVFSYMDAMRKDIRKKADTSWNFYASFDGGLKINFEKNF